jgi:hypothetical protein
VHILDDRFSYDFSMTGVRVPGVVSIDADYVNILSLYINREKTIQTLYQILSRESIRARVLRKKSKLWVLLQLDLDCTLGPQQLQPASYHQGLELY